MRKQGPAFRLDVGQSKALTADAAHFAADAAVKPGLSRKSHRAACGVSSAFGLHAVACEPARSLGHRDTPLQRCTAAVRFALPFGRSHEPSSAEWRIAMLQCMIDDVARGSMDRTTSCFRPTAPLWCGHAKMYGRFCHDKSKHDPAAERG
ncbi:hypothetical protein [Variovorax paradoxus]|uniref:hypothetical protein n=1 Tax=Variovorax paradoxus TaxID=34073 RepID=UPI00155E0D4E